MSRLSFLLLHEVPDDTKRKVIDRIMMSVPVGGKAIFIEYHKPAWYSPWRYMMPIVYWLLEPLAFTVWNHQITELGRPRAGEEVQVAKGAAASWVSTRSWWA